jgi:hypothetical protein
MYPMGMRFKPELIAFRPVGSETMQWELSGTGWEPLGTSLVPKWEAFTDRRSAVSGCALEARAHAGFPPLVYPSIDSGSSTENRAPQMDVETA